VVERRRDEPVRVDLGDPGCAGPGQRGVLLHVCERPPPGGLVGLLDLPADPLVAQGPQHRHRLDRGEDQVDTGHRLPRRLRGPSDERLQLAIVGRITLLCLTEELGSDVPPDQIPLRSPLRPAAVSLVELLVCRVEAIAPRVTGVLHHRVPAAEPNGRLRVLERGSSRHRGTDPGLRVRVHALPEEGLHLRLGHPPVDAHRDLAGADPPSRWVPVGEVVVAQRLAAQRLMIAGRDLPGQIRVAVAGVKHVHRHHRRLSPPIGRLNRSV